MNGGYALDHYCLLGFITLAIWLKEAGFADKGHCDLQSCLPLVKSCCLKCGVRRKRMSITQPASVRSPTAKLELWIRVDLSKVSGLCAYIANVAFCQHH